MKSLPVFFFSLFAFVLLLSFLLTNSQVDLDGYLPFWAAAKTLLAGRNPYSALEVAAHLKSLGINTELLESAWALPATLGYFSLFAWMSLHHFELTYGCLTLVLFSTSLFLLLRFSAPELKASDLCSICILLALLSTITFLPIGLAVRYGPLVGLPLLSICGFLAILATSKRPLQSSFLAGVVLSFVLLKLHLVMLLLYWIGLKSLQTRQFSTLLGLAFGLACFHLPLFILEPSVFDWYLSAWLQPEKTQLPSPREYLSPTTASWLATYLQSRAFTVLLLPTATAVALLPFVAWRSSNISAQKDELIYLSLVILPLSLTCAPYLWGYDFVLLTPAMVLFFVYGWNWRGTPYFAVCFIPFLMNILMLVSPANMLYLVWVAPLCLILGVLLLSRILQVSD